MSGAAELDFDALLQALTEVVDDGFWYERLESLARQRDRVLHVAIMHEPYLSLLIEGTKTIESRFSSRRVRPFEGVGEGDVLVLKRQSGPVVGIALVESAHFYELDPTVLEVLRSRYAGRIGATDDDFWHQRAEASYATLINVTHPHGLPDVRLEKRDRRGWACLAPSR